MSIEQQISSYTIEAVQTLFGTEIQDTQIQLQKTNKDFTGDLSLVVFPFVKAARKSPEQTAQAIGDYLKEHIAEITAFNVVKGFLNMEITSEYYLEQFSHIRHASSFGFTPTDTASKSYIVEYSSPNTNKPLHLGHIRNNLLGWSVAEILKANGKVVIKVNLVNDRGIHICKSMLAWEKYGKGETPQNSGLKGDHLVGKYYVLFNTHYQAQIKDLMAEGLEKEEAERKAPLMLEAQEMLRQWEAGNKEVVDLWKMMNGWVYEGFAKTYAKMGIDFDKTYYESQTYLLGKSIVEKGLKEGHLIQKEDASIWADLRDEGLDEKLLLRKDGTSVYMTQDLGTAQQRQKDYDAEKLIYVVGNEQNYHFDVLKRVLRKLGYPWSEGISHLSYGMVELPEGKMKSREGTVVDADDLIQAMTDTAQRTTEELGKVENLGTAEQAQALYHTIAMGALKYFILKVDPSKNMLFNPKESIDFNGNTGPFIQYTHARICSLLRKASYAAQGTGSGSSNAIHFDLKELTPFISHKEKALLKLLSDYPNIVKLSGEMLSPAIIANYIFDLSKEFNGFYQDTPILREENENLKNFRLALCQFTGKVLASGLGLLGIIAPEKM